MKKAFKLLSFIFLVSLLLFNCEEQKDVNSEVSENFKLRKITGNKGKSNKLLEIPLIKINYNNKNLFESEIGEININKKNILAVITYNKKDLLIAYEVFYSKNNILKHSFYKDNNKVFDLKDNQINPNNIEFIFNYYLSKHNDLKIYLKINNNFKLENFSNNSEFEIFKTSILHKNGTFNKNNQLQLTEIADSGLCSLVCAPMGRWGSCNWNTLECVSKSCWINEARHSSNVLNNFTNQIVSNLLIDDNLYYDLRDVYLDNSIKGRKLISYYYSLSSFLDISSFSMNDLTDIFSILTKLKVSVNKLNTNSTDIIIDNTLKNEMLNLINKFKQKSVNTDYQFILNDLSNEIILFAGKDKNQIMNVL